jgi:hypothetical protein
MVAIWSLQFLKSSFCLDNFSNKSVDRIKEFPEVLSFSYSSFQVVKCAALFVDDGSLFGNDGCVCPYVNSDAIRSAPEKTQKRRIQQYPTRRQTSRPTTYLFERPATAHNSLSGMPGGLSDTRYI